jgi:hypothetical protein
VLLNLPPQPTSVSATEVPPPWARDQLEGAKSAAEQQAEQNGIRYIALSADPHPDLTAGRTAQYEALTADD